MADLAPAALEALKGCIFHDAYAMAVMDRAHEGGGLCRCHAFENPVGHFNHVHLQSPGGENGCCLKTDITTADNNGFLAGTDKSLNLLDIANGSHIKDTGQFSTGQW